MPHIEIKLYPGYGREKLEKLTADLVETVAKDLEVPERVISLAYEEVLPEQWDARVYRTLIDGREGLAKAPDYR